ncbi:hypothetical protein U9R90_05460 [Streptomyces sp. E11-3]|uniref:hypothetical protein n=1 Tax=Streptomyces sp. E11-3 TaxID=3110112 RepID=UPI003981351A
MSLVTRGRRLARHRGKTPMQLRVELDEAVCTLIALTTEVDNLGAERAQLELQLDQAGIDLSGALEDLRASEAEKAHLRIELHALRAFKANVLATTVPPMERDIDPDEQPTHPTGFDVRPLWDALGPVVAVAAPRAADPAHIPHTTRIKPAEEVA